MSSARGEAFRGRAPQITACAPLPKENCAPNIVKGSVPLEYKSRPETPKILIINPESVSKDRFFTNSVVKTFFLFCLHSRSRGNKVFVSPKNYLCSPSHATLAPGLSGKTLTICYNLQAKECGNLKLIQNTKILQIKATRKPILAYAVKLSQFHRSKTEKKINIETLYLGSKPTEIDKKKGI